MERFALRRHSFVEAVGGNFLEQQAGGRFARDDGGAVLAALADELGGVKAQPVVLLERAVAGVATRGKDGLHVAQVVHLAGGGSRHHETGEDKQGDEFHGRELDSPTKGLHQTTRLRVLKSLANDPKPAQTAATMKPLQTLSKDEHRD